MNDKYLASYKELNRSDIEKIIYKQKDKNEFEWFVFGVEQLLLVSEDINKITVSGKYIIGECAFFSMRSYKVYPKHSYGYTRFLQALSCFLQR